MSYLMDSPWDVATIHVNIKDLLRVQIMYTLRMTKFNNFLEGDRAHLKSWPLSKEKELNHHVIHFSMNPSWDVATMHVNIKDLLRVQNNSNKKKKRLKILLTLNKLLYWLKVSVILVWDFACLVLFTAQNYKSEQPFIRSMQKVWFSLTM